MIDFTVKLAGVVLKNPIVTASGCFGFGQEYGRFFDLSRLGAICVKGLTLAPRKGNPPPRAAETPMGMLNSVGLQNPGAAAFLETELPRLRSFNTKIIANISGFSLEEYAELAGMLGGAVDLLEVNISCPNIKKGGMSFGLAPESAAAVTRAVKARAKCPVLVKLSPNVTDIAAVAAAAAREGADGLSLINTLTGMRIDPDSRRPILRMNTGGLSGPAVLPVALRCVWQVSNAVKLPVLGMGGVSTASDAVEMLLAGASAVAVGTAMFRDPYAPMKILAGLEDYARRHSLQSLSELTGGVQTWDA